MVGNPIKTFARRALIIFPLTVLALIAGLACLTQDIAEAFHCPRALGPGLTNVGPVRIYAPGWSLRYGRSDPLIFHGAILSGLLTAFLPLMLAIIAGARETGNRRSLTEHIVQETTMPAKPIHSVGHAWRNVLPAAAPGCSQGTPYSFWVKEEDSTKLAVIFSGGGACWTGENCALHCRPHYRAFAGLEQDPSDLGGIFDTDNVENPLADYTLIFLPTANGDLFLGDSAPVYDTPAMNGYPEGKLTILHKGFDNAMLALDWMFRTYPQAKTVAVMAGAPARLPRPCTRTSSPGIIPTLRSHTSPTAAALIILVRSSPPS